MTTCACGTEFEQAKVGPRTAKCHKCRLARKKERDISYMQRKREKVCHACGKAFMGTHNAVRCPKCKEARKRQFRHDQYIKNVKGRVSRYKKRNGIEFSNDPNMVNGIYC